MRGARVREESGRGAVVAVLRLLPGGAGAMVKPGLCWLGCRKSGRGRRSLPPTELWVW